jgi:hypothetical protein
MNVQGHVRTMTMSSRSAGGVPPSEADSVFELVCPVFQLLGAEEEIIPSFTGRIIRSPHQVHLSDDPTAVESAMKILQGFCRERENFNGLWAQ